MSKRNLCSRVPAVLLFWVTGCANGAQSDTPSSSDPDSSAALDAATNTAAVSTTDAALASEAGASTCAVFDPTCGDRVLTLNVSIASADFRAMLGDMTEMAGEFGAGGGLPSVTAADGGAPPAGLGGAMAGPPQLGAGGAIGAPEELFLACEELSEGDACEFTLGGAAQTGSCQLESERLLCAPAGGGMLAGGGQPGGIGDDAEFLPRTPVWVPCNVEMNGQRWDHVGIRFKGNSTLTSAWSRGSYKLPLRLRFDKFQDEYPDTKQQRFYGRQSVSLGNNGSDPSFVREILATETLRAGGVPAPHAVLARVNIDVGEGEQYFGLYTLVEVPGKALLEEQLGGAGGNLYKPQGTGARLGEFIQDDFEKQTNEDEDDYTDVQNLITALNADRSDAAAWREELERHLNVRGFLRWLALNAMIGNWDTYGRLAHNYYLYASPSDGDRLHWLPWDQDLSFGSGQQISFTYAETDASWPLIRHLLDDEEYAAFYTEEAARLLEEPLLAPRLETRARELHALAAPHVVGTDGERPGYTGLNSAAEFRDALEGERALVGVIESLRTGARATFESTP